MPESRLTAEGGGMGCGLLALLAEAEAEPPARRLLGEEFSELAPDEEELLLPLLVAVLELLLLMVDALEAGGGLAKWLPALLLLLGVTGNEGVIAGACPICETALQSDPRADFSALGSLLSLADVGGSTALGLALRRRRLCTSSSWMRG